ncbi:hypothetical protein GGX14DRAFT_455351, partial [Mycena pura]
GHRLPGIARPFIHTQHLADIFEKRGSRLNKHAALEVFNQLRTHSLTNGVKAITIDKCGGRGRIRTMGMTLATELVTGTVNGLASAGAFNSFYWLPTASNFPGIDGVLVDRKGNLFAEGLRKVWEIIDKPVGKSRSWNFVVMAKSLETLRLGTRKKTVDVWCCSL